MVEVFEGHEEDIHRLCHDTRRDKIKPRFDLSGFSTFTWYELVKNRSICALRNDLDLSWISAPDHFPSATSYTASMPISSSPTMNWSYSPNVILSSYTPTFKHYPKHEKNIVTQNDFVLRAKRVCDAIPSTLFKRHSHFHQINQNQLK